MKHYFDVDVASDVGVHAAVVFENIAYWIEHNRKAGKNEKEGTFWMYSTQTDLAGQFQYLSVKQTRTAIEKLIGAGYLKPGCFNRHGYDRTRWYALAEKGSTVIQARQNDPPKSADGGAENDATIPDRKTDRITKIDQTKIDRIRRICGIV